MTNETWHEGALTLTKKDDGSWGGVATLNGVTFDIKAWGRKAGGATDGFAVYGFYCRDQFLDSYVDGLVDKAHAI